MKTRERFIHALLAVAVIGEAVLFTAAWYAFTHTRPDYLLAFGGHFFVYLALPVALAAATVGLLSARDSPAHLAAVVLFAFLTVYIVVDLIGLFSYMLAMSAGL